MSYDKNAFKATGTAPHENFDFMAITGDKKTWAPTWGFLTRNWSPLVMFKIGGSFGGFHYGVQGYGGYPDDRGKIGPKVNSYSDFAGVFGTGVYVGGVAGTSALNVGVYGQTGELTDIQVPQNILAGVFGATTSNYRYGVVGWSTNGTGVKGWSPGYTGVEAESVHGQAIWAHSVYEIGVLGYSQGAAAIKGVSDPIAGTEGPTILHPVTIAGVIGTSDSVHGVIGTSNAQVGVFAYSYQSHAIFAHAQNPAAFAGIFAGNVYSNGTIFAAVKNGVVPFPDGSQRILHCMESPEHWFEDFGSGKIARGRAVVKLDADFVKVIKSRDYRVFVTAEGDCRGLYVPRKGAANFEVRELMGGKSSVAFSYRIVGRRKDIKAHRRFAKIEMPLPLPTKPVRAPRKPAPTPAELRAFIARVEKEARERAPRGAQKGRARMRAGGKA